MPAFIAALIFALLGIGMIFTLLRLLIGPTLADRVVALDLLGFVAMGFIAANILVSGEGIYLDVIIVAALILFFGTIGFARYLERRTR